MKPYSHVRFRWWDGVDLKETLKKFEEFETESKEPITDPREIGLHKDTRIEVVVKADTLQAWLSKFRAVLGQREAAPFTPRDVELRDKVREIYDHDRPTPFPWSWVPEPDYEVKK